MSLLQALGLAKKDNPSKPAKPKIELHPQCMSAHGSLVSLYLGGHAIEVMNPNTQNWEDCASPVFDPQHAYRLKAVSIPAPAPKQCPPAFTTEYTATTPPPPCKFSRGDIYKSTAGNCYMVLGNKYDLIPNYNPHNDPDSGPLIVMRYEEGVKPAVSCRSLRGTRKDNAPKFALTLFVKAIPMQSPHNHHKTDTTRICLSERSTTDVYVRRSTGEVIFR